MRTSLEIAVVVCMTVPAVGAADEGKKPTIKVEQEKRGDRVFTMVRIAVPTIPNFECDVWCYEASAVETRLAFGSAAVADTAKISR